MTWRPTTSARSLCAWITCAFFLSQARKHWLKVDYRQSQGHLAIALKRFSALKASNDPTPTEIMKSIRERSVTNEEMGMFWRETELSWWWYRAPIETQALMIEAFDEVMGDRRAVEGCRVWLLKQKQRNSTRSRPRSNPLRPGTGALR